MLFIAGTEQISVLFAGTAKPKTYFSNKRGTGFWCDNIFKLARVGYWVWVIREGPRGRAQREKILKDVMKEETQHHVANCNFGNTWKWSLCLSTVVPGGWRPIASRLEAIAISNSKEYCSSCLPGRARLSRLVERRAIVDSRRLELEVFPVFSSRGFKHCRINTQCHWINAKAIVIRTRPEIFCRPEACAEMAWFKLVPKTESL